MRKWKIPYLRLLPVLFIAFFLFKIVSSMNISLSSILSTLYSCIAYFVWGFVIAYLLNPAVGYFERLVASARDSQRVKLLKRGGIIAFLYLLLAGMLTLFVVAILPTIVDGVKDFIDNMPHYADNMERWMNDFWGGISPDLAAQVEGFVEKAFIDLYGLLTSLDYSSIGGAVSNAVSVSVTAILRFLFGIIISIYFLIFKEGAILHVKRILYALLSEQTAQKAVQLGRDIHAIFMNFLVSKILQSFVLFIIGLIVLIPLRIPLAPLIALVIGVTNMIPYFGPYIGGIPCVLLVLFYDPWKALWTALFAVGIQVVDNVLVGPKIMSDKVGINPVLVIAGVTIGGKFGGLLGMFLGVPFIAVAKLIFYDRFIERRLKAKNVQVK